MLRRQRVRQRLGSCVRWARASLRTGAVTGGMTVEMELTRGAATLMVLTQTACPMSLPAEMGRALTLAGNAMITQTAEMGLMNKNVMTTPKL